MSKMLPPAVLLERNKTDLLSKVQSKGRSSASLRVRRRGADSRGPLAKNSAPYTARCALHLLKTSLLPSVVALGRIIIFATGNLHGSAGRTAIAGVHDYAPKVENSEPECRFCLHTPNTFRREKLQMRRRDFPWGST